MKKTPEVDLSRCTLCLGCIEICPDVFRLNPAGYLEVTVMEEYPEDLVDQAAVICPGDAIYWIETRTEPKTDKRICTGENCS